MKEEIQRKLMSEQSGMALAERRENMEIKILADPVLGPWFRQLRATPMQDLSVAENPEPYGRRPQP